MSLKWTAMFLSRARVVTSHAVILHRFSKCWGSLGALLRAYANFPESLTHSRGSDREIDEWAPLSRGGLFL